MFDRAKAIFGWIWDVIQAWMGKLGSFYTAVRDTFTRVVDVIRGLYDRFVQGGKNIIIGLVNGIKSMASRPIDAIRDIMGKVRDFLPFSPAKEGPFSGKGWSEYSGAAIVDGLITGMQSRESDLRSVMGGILGDGITVARSSSPGAYRADGATPGAGGFSVGTIVINNPTAEPTSESLPKTVRKKAYVGVGS
jgi:phage-related protein